MARLSKKQIINAVSSRFGINPAYIELVKTDGFYYWSGDAGDVFIDGLTGQNDLYSTDLNWWLSDFGDRLENWKNTDTGINYNKDLNAFIERPALDLSKPVILSHTKNKQRIEKAKKVNTGTVVFLDFEDTDALVNQGEVITKSTCNRFTVHLTQREKDARRNSKAICLTVRANQLDDLGKGRQVYIQSACGGYVVRVYLTRAAMKLFAGLQEAEELTYEHRSGYVCVHRWGTYEDGVLKGQPKKTFVDRFDTEKEALAAYPDAEPSHPVLQEQNYFNHLPDRNDD